MAGVREEEEKDYEENVSFVSFLERGSHVPFGRRLQVGI
jgi:hypothetical protein